MQTSKHYFPIALLGLFVLSCEDQVSLETDQVTIEEEPLPMNFKDGDEFEDAAVFFEKNTTDDDLGLQVFVDNEAWRQLNLRDPEGREQFNLKAGQELAELGITEFRFESAEPSPAEVLALFDEGIYTLRGRTVEGDKLLSMVEVSHDFVDFDEDDISPADGDLVDPDNLVVTWEIDGAENVEVIIEDEDEENILSILVAADEGELTIPHEFLEEGAEYKLEVIATGENGNRTIVEINFETNGVAI